MVEEIVEADDDEQAQEMLEDMYTNFVWQVAQIERLPDDE